PMSAKGTLVIQPKPIEAHVIVDGVDRGTGNVTVGDLELNKEIKVRIEAPGYRPFDQPITLTVDSKELTMPVQLARASGSSSSGNQTIAPAVRTVQLIAPFERWANVYYKNKFLGSTPVKAQLPVGDVELTIVNETTKLNKTIKVAIPDTGSDKV